MPEKTLTKPEIVNDLEIECKTFLTEMTKIDHFDQIHADEADDILNDMLRFGEYLAAVEKLISEGADIRIAMFHALAVSPAEETQED